MAPLLKSDTYVTWSGLFRSVLSAPTDVALQSAWEATLEAKQFLQRALFLDFPSLSILC